MIGRLLNQPLTIQRRSSTTKDEYGNDVPATDSTVATVGYVEQVDAIEITIDRETYRTDWKVWLPEGTAIDGNDRVAIDTRLLEVIGKPGPGAWNPRVKRYQHIVCRAREVTG